MVCGLHSLCGGADQAPQFRGRKQVAKVGSDPTALAQPARGSAILYLGRAAQSGEFGLSFSLGGDGGEQLSTLEHRLPGQTGLFPILP